MTTSALDYCQSIAESIDENWDESHDRYDCAFCDEGDCEKFSTIDYLEDALDIEIETSFSGEYRGARVLVTCGGPNTWIDTRGAYVESHWGSDSADWSVAREFCEALDDTISMMRDC